MKENELSDNELVEQARLNIEEAKLELFSRSKDTITYSIGKYKAGFWKGLNKSDIEDLTSLCYIAVMEAIEVYNPTKGASFAHFLKFKIRKYLYKWTENKIEESNVIQDISEQKLNRIPFNDSIEEIKRDLLIKVKNERDKEIIDLFLSGMRQTDIADEFKISRARVHQIIQECIK